jgi:hypothetical protein
VRGPNNNGLYRYARASCSCVFACAFCVCSLCAYDRPLLVTPPQAHPAIAQPHDPHPLSPNKCTGRCIGPTHQHQNPNEDPRVCAMWNRGDGRADVIRAQWSGRQILRHSETLLFRDREDCWHAFRAVTVHCPQSQGVCVWRSLSLPMSSSVAPPSLPTLRPRGTISTAAVFALTGPLRAFTCVCCIVRENICASVFGS